MRTRVRGIDWEAVRLAFDVDVKNSYPVGIRTPRFTYELAVEDEPFLDSEEPMAVDIPARSTDTATLPMRLRYGQLLSAVTRLAGRNEASYRLSGVVFLRGLFRTHELPVEHSGTFPILKPLRITGIGAPSLALVPQELALTVTETADLENPNAFEVGISRLDFDLKLGDFDVAGLSASTGQAIPAKDSGSLTLTGTITAGEAVAKFFQGTPLGAPNIEHRGSLDSP